MSANQHHATFREQQQLIYSSITKGVVVITGTLFTKIESRLLYDAFIKINDPNAVKVTMFYLPRSYSISAAQKF